MKTVFTSLTLVVLLASFTLINLKPVNSDDAVTFTIKNFGISTGGEFKGLKGVIKWDAGNPSASSFNVSVDANTVNTDVDARDNHLRKEEYFNAAKYPTINFASTAVSPGNITGNLTIKGVTKSVSFPFTVTPSGNGYIFEGSFTINRLDFGVGSSSMVLGDNVTVKLKVTTAQ